VVPVESFGQVARERWGVGLDPLVQVYPGYVLRHKCSAPARDILKNNEYVS
jgi:hypothetical protein